MLKTVSSFLVLSSLAACAASTSVQAPVSQLVPPENTLIAVPATQTLSETAWTITVPATFERQESAAGDLDGLDKTNSLGLFMQVHPFAGDMPALAMTMAIGMASRGIDVEKIDPGTWAGYEAIMVSASHQTPRGMTHFRSWTALEKGHAYVFGCIQFPGAERENADRICDQAANSVKLNPLPTPDAPATEVPAKPKHKR